MTIFHFISDLPQNKVQYYWLLPILKVFECCHFQLPASWNIKTVLQQQMTKTLHYKYFIFFKVNNIKRENYRARFGIHWLFHKIVFLKIGFLIAILSVFLLLFQILIGNKYGNQTLKTKLDLHVNHSFRLSCGAFIWELIRSDLLPTHFLTCSKSAYRAKDASQNFY